MDPDVENGPPVLGIFCLLPPVAEFKLSEGAEDTNSNTIPEDPERPAPPPPPGPESNASSPQHQQTEPSASDDFDERAAEFWRVYANEAQNYDEASIGTWRADMKGIIIFVSSPPTTQVCKSIPHALSPSGGFIFSRLDRLYRREPKKAEAESF